VELEIFRTITPAGGKPPASPPAGQPWKILAEKDLAPPTQSASAAVPIALSDAELAQFKSSAWTFYLRALTRGFRRHPVLSDWSNPARRVLQNVSEPPEGIQVETKKRAGDSLSSTPNSFLRLSSATRRSNPGKGMPIALTPWTGQGTSARPRRKSTSKRADRTNRAGVL